MTAEALDYRALLDATLPDDPWCRSSEGLDDGCHFCGSSVHDYTSQASTYYHEPDCDWIVGMDALGRPHPDHLNSGHEEMQARRRAEHAEWLRTAPGWAVEMEDYYAAEINRSMEMWDRVSRGEVRIDTSGTWTRTGD